MKNLIARFVLISLTLTAGVAHAEGWTTYNAEKFGFSMLVPEGTKFAEKELSAGWGMLQALYPPLGLFAIGKLGDAETPEAIQKFGVEVTGMGAEHWKLVDHGAGMKGWKWHRSVKAENGGHIVFGGYGVGPKGNYLLLLKTTAEDFAKHQAEYHKWYASIVIQ